MMYHAMRGIGDCTFDDPSGCAADGVDYSAGSSGSSTGPILSSASNASQQQQVYNQQYGTTATGNASSGFNWGLLAPLFGAAGAIGSGYAASELKPGQSMQTAGTTITGAGMALPGSTLSGGLNLSSMMLPLMLLGGGLILVMAMKGHGK